jgi:hypothetical protein
MKKHKTTSRLLSWLLISVVMLTMLPVQGFASLPISGGGGGVGGSGAQEPGGAADPVYQVGEDSLAMAELLSRMGLASADAGNTEQSDDLYIIDGRRYKAIYNDYIACYVSAEPDERGGYAILPAAVSPASPSALGLAAADSLGGAVLCLDGEEYVFGGDYPEKNSYLFMPEVRNDILMTHWNIGDYIITQYQAITQDISRENSYAVKVAYAAEYFGPAGAPSEISGRMILPVRLGEDGKAPLVTDAGGLLLGGTVLAPVPAEIWMETGDGPQAFFVLNEHNAALPMPERLALGDRADLLAGGEPAPFAELTDPAAAFTFAPRTLTIPEEGAENLNSNLCAFLVNYGYYNLTAAAPDWTVDAEAARQSAALSQLTMSLLAAAETREVPFSVTTPGWNMETDGAVKLTRLTWQLPGDDTPTAVVMSGEALMQDSPAFQLPAGATVRFSLAIADEDEAERIQISGVYAGSGDLANDEPLTPDAGLYTMTLPPANYGLTYGVTVEITPQPGYVPLNTLNEKEFLGITVQEASPSRYAVKASETVSLKLTASGPFWLDGSIDNSIDEMDPFPGVYYLDDAYIAFNINLASGSRLPDADGVLAFSFVVPTGVPGMREVGFDCDRPHVPDPGAWRYASVNVVPRDAVAGGLLALSGDSSSWFNGIFRAAANTVVTIDVPTLESGYNESNTYLSVFDTYFGEAVELSYGEPATTTDQPIALSDLSGEDTVTFTMPDSDVEVRLAASEYPKIFTEVKYTDSGGNDITTGYSGPRVAVTVLPDPVEQNDTVTLRLEHLLEGGAEPFDLNATTVTVEKKSGGAAIPITTYLAGHEYSFTMPNEDVMVTATMRVAATPVPVYTLSTRPLAEGGDIRGGIWAWEKYTTQTNRPKPAQDGTSAQIPVGATVEYYAYEPDYTDTWEIKKVYLAKADDPENTAYHTALYAGYANDSPITYHTFTMPAYDAVIVVQGGNYPYPIKTESVYVLASEVTGGDYLNAPYTPLLNNYAAAYDEALTSSNAGNLTPIDAIMPGETAWISAAEIVGYKLKGVYLLMDGWAPRELTLTSQLADDWWYTSFFRMSAIGRGATVRAVYEIIDPVQITYVLPQNSDGLRLDAQGAVRHATASAAKDPHTGQVIGDKYFAQDIVYIYNDNPTERAYSLQTGENINLGGGVRADISKNDYVGCVGYDVWLSWPTSGVYPADIQIPITGDDVDYKNARFDSAAPNHTNPAKFESVAITGDFSAETVEENDIYLVVYDPSGAYVSPPILQKYKIDWANASGTITPASGDDPATMALNLKAPGAVAAGAPAFSEMGQTPLYDEETGTTTYRDNTKRVWGIQIGYRPLFLTNAGAGIEYGSGGQAVVNFNLHAAEVNYAAPPKYYLSILRGRQDQYAMKVGATEAEVQGGGDYPTTVLTFYNEKGFFADNPANPTSVQISDEGAQKVSFNGGMFLETYGPGTLKFTQDDQGVHMEAVRMRLQALNTPLYVPSYVKDQSSTLRLDMENGKLYSLNAADGGGWDYITFVPVGAISIDIAGWTGFAAGIDEIRVTKNSVNVKGGLWLTWPFAHEPFGGFGVERLELEINKGQDYFARFKGIEAEGQFDLPELYIMGGTSYARINTFENDYYFETEASMGPASLGGFLHLTESERLGIWLPNSFYIDFDLGEAGVPLVPPAVVGWITGVSGGISNMVDTIDYDWRTTFFPPIELTVGAHFKLVQLLGFHAEITSGFYSMTGTLSGSLEIGGVGLDIIDYLTFQFGLFNEQKRPGSNCSRAYAKIGVHIGLALSNEYLEDVVKGNIGGEFGLKFDNPLQVGWDAVFAYMEDQSTQLSATQLINLLALEYASKAKGGVEVNFPQIGPFGPFHIAGAYAYMNMSVRLNIQPQGLFASSGWIAGRARLLENLRGWFAYDIMSENLTFGTGDLPSRYASLAGVSAYELRAMAAFQSAPNELGEGLRVVADTETSGPYSLAPDTFAFALSAAPVASAVKIYSGKDGDVFTRRFTLPSDKQDYFLAVRQLEAGADAELRLYAPNGAEISLNVWDAEKTVSESDARFVHNTIAGLDGSGNRTWLIALPEAASKVGSGEWTLKSSRDLTVQLWQQEAMAQIGAVALSGGPSTSGNVSLSASTVTIPLENLKPEGNDDGEQNYQYSLDLVRRAAPDGEALTTIQVPLGTVNPSAEGGGNDQNGVASKVGAYYADVSQGTNEAKTLTATLYAADILADDVAAGDYYPEIVLYHYYGPDADGAEQRLPLDRATGYEPVTVANSTFAAVTVGNLTARAGQNQSIEATFAGVSQDADYAALKNAGYLVTGYSVAAYGADGLPVQAMPAAGLTLSYDSAGNLPADADLSHMVVLSGLAPGLYTVGVRAIFASKSNIAVQSDGVETTPSGATTVVAAVTPTLTLSLSGGAIQDDGGGKVLIVGPDFALTVTTDVGADISFVRYRDKAEMAAAAGGTTLTLTAQEYFSKNSGTVDGKEVVGGYETLMITAVDNATLGSSNQVVTIVPDLSPPTLVIDDLAGDTRVIATTDGSFTVKGRTQPGLSASLLNAAAPLRVTADDEGRFSLSGALPPGSDGQIAVSVLGASGLTASQTLKIEQVNEADFTALELTPAGPLTMTPGDTLALSVLGLKADGGKINLSPGSLTFTATGVATVDAGGVLTVAGPGAGAVVARLGALESNTLRISVVSDPVAPPAPPSAPPTASGGTGRSAATSPSPTHGYIITTPEDKPPVTDAEAMTTLPGGGTIKTPEGLTVTAPEGTTIDKGGLISTPGSAKILTAGGTTLTAPGGTTIDRNGTVTPPPSAGAAVTLSSGLALKLRAGTVVILDEKVPLGYRTIFENPFADVKAGDWFFDDVGFVYTHNLFAGTGATAFSPDTAMTRGMVATALGRLHGIDLSGAQGDTFGDVDAACLEWARTAGVMNGAGDDSFEPDAPVSWQDLSVILYNYVRFAGKELPSQREYENFADEADVAAYAKEAVQALYRAGVISAQPGNLFDPKGLTTRAEAAAMLRRLIISVSDGAVPLSPAVTGETAPASDSASAPNPKTGSDGASVPATSGIAESSAFALSPGRKEEEEPDGDEPDGDREDE